MAENNNQSLDERAEKEPGRTGAQQLRMAEKLDAQFLACFSDGWDADKEDERI
jgi:hypothetical protein